MDNQPDSQPEGQPEAQPEDKVKKIGSYYVPIGALWVKEDKESNQFLVGNIKMVLYIFRNHIRNKTGKSPDFIVYTKKDYNAYRIREKSARMSRERNKQQEPKLPEAAPIEAGEI